MEQIYAYGWLRTVTHPDAKTWQLFPIETIGLPTGASGNVLKAPIDAQAAITDGSSNVRTRTYNTVQSFEWDYRNRLVTVKDRHISGDLHRM